MGKSTETSFNDKYLNKIEQWYDNYEPFYEVPVTTTRKEKNGEEAVTERMERVYNPPPFKTDLAKHLGINRSTLYKWINEIPKCSNTIKRMHKEVFEDVLVKNGLMDKYSTAFAIFTAKNCIGWTDKQENTHKFPEPVIFRNPDGEIYKKITFND